MYVDKALFVLRVVYIRDQLKFSCVLVTYYIVQILTAVQGSSSYHVLSTKNYISLWLYPVRIWLLRELFLHESREN